MYRERRAVEALSNPTDPTVIFEAALPPSTQLNRRPRLVGLDGWMDGSVTLKGIHERPITPAAIQLEQKCAKMTDISLQNSTAVSG